MSHCPFKTPIKLVFIYTNANSDEMAAKLYIAAYLYSSLKKFSECSQKSADVFIISNTRHIGNDKL